MRSASFALMCLPFLVSLSAQSQGMASLQQGVRIRVQGQKGGETAGNFETMDGDSLRFAPVHKAVRGVPFSAIKEIDVSHGRSHGEGLFKGAGIGGVFGVVSGALLGAATYNPSDGGEGCYLFCSRGSTAVFSGTILGMVGIVIGSVVGGAIGSEVWEPVFTKSH